MVREEVPSYQRHLERERKKRHAIRLIVATMANAVQEGRQGEANTEAAPAAEAAAE